MKTIGIKLLFFTMLIILMTTCKKEEERGDLEIIVCDSNRTPLAGASVIINNTSEEKTTDENGKVVFDDLKIGVYSVTAKKKGYDNGHKDLEIEHGRTKTTEIELLLEQNLTSPSTLFFSDNLTEKTFPFRLEGEGAIKWEVENNNNWFYVSRNEGILDANSCDTLTVIIDKYLQQQKDTVGTFRIYGKNFSNKIEVYVRKGIPVIISDPPLLNFGESLNILPVTIKNEGHGLLKWNVNETIEWLVSDFYNGETQKNSVIKVSIDRSQMQLGVNNESFEIISTTGEIVSVAVVATKKETPVINCDVNDVTSTLALISGNIISNGGHTIEVKGVCYDQNNPNPNTGNTVISAGNGDDDFNAVLENLQPNTTYYAKTFVKYAGGQEAYSESRNFTTPSTETLPVVISTLNSSSISYNSVVAGGQVVSDGGFSITEQGVCYKIVTLEDTVEATIDDLVAQASLGNSNFNVTLSQLSPGTKYSIKAYAKNSLGISYGENLFFTTTSQTNDWLQLNNVGEQERHLGFAFSDGTNVYVGGGISDFEPRNDFKMYNPITKTWTEKATLPRRLRAAVGFMINGIGYVGTGIDETGVANNIFWKYDSFTNEWSEIGNFPGVARANAVVFVIDSKAYIGTGSTEGGTFLNDFYRFDPETETFSAITSLGTANSRDGAVAFSINEKGYCGLGFNGVYKNDFWEYDPSTNQWTVLNSENSPTERRWAVAFSVGNDAYVGTGIYETSFYNGFYKFDGYTWTSVGDFRGKPRTQGVATSTSTKGYVGTGRSNTSHMKDLWEYTPE